MATDSIRDSIADRAAKRFDWIIERFDEGHSVIVSTMTRATRYKPRHRGMIRLRNGCVEAQSGRNWLDITHCKLTAE